MSPDGLLSALVRLGPVKRVALAGALLAGAVVAWRTGRIMLGVLTLALVGAAGVVAAVVVEVVRRARRSAARARRAREREERRRRRRARPPTRVAEGLGAKVDAGFVSLGLERLEALAGDAGARPSERGRAHYELALQAGARADMATMLGHLDRALDVDPTSVRVDEQTLLRVDSLIELGRHDEARAALHERFGGDPTEADALLRLGNTLRPGRSEPAARLRPLNRLLAAAGLPGVTAGEDIATIDTLRTGCSPGSAEGPLVSVLVPVRNAEGTLATAVRSLLQQSWQNLEILVVDDASDDESRRVAESLARTDPRVHTYVRTRQAGAYAARNLALEHATGDFITVHDADDWSHAHKIEVQVRGLLADASLVGTLSRLARVDDDLTVRVPPPRKPRRGLVTPNASSLLVRREVFDRIGAWDDVRFGADTEFIQRARTAYGDATIVEVRPEVPLMLCRNGPGTLTSEPRTGVRSAAHVIGARRLYAQAYRRWHDSPSFPDSLPYRPGTSTGRPFVGPAVMTGDDGDDEGDGRAYDVIILTDLSLIGGSFASTLEEVRAQRAAGLRTGLVHNPVFAWKAATADLNPKVWEVVDGQRVSLLTRGEAARCHDLVVRAPKVLEALLDDLPRITAARTHVIVNQAPQHHYDGGSPVLWDVPRCVRAARQAFGDAVVWRPIGPVVREALLEHHGDDLGDVTLADEDWVNVIDPADWARKGPTGPGAATSARVTIGRHARDSAEKWPEDPDDLLAAYPDDPALEVAILGGADVPRQRLGGLPDSWRVHDFDEVTPRDFLAGLDVFVYFTHPGLQEAFGRSVLEAMAAGVPVVTMPTLRPLFGDAALYCTPAEVRDVVTALVTDRERYDQQVATAARLVAERFSHATHVRRLGSDPS